MHELVLAAMLTVTLFRHAKSSWEALPATGAAQGDKARPLARRGREDAPRMAAWMAAHAIRPDAVLCSTAVRTRQTLDLALPILGVDGGAVTWRDDLYLAEATTLVSIVRKLPARVKHVMLVGHDPGMHDLATMLAGSGEPALRRLLAEKFPTAGVAVVDFDTDVWSAIAAGRGRLRHFMAPKRLAAQ